MKELKSFEEIMKSMLDRVNNAYDKREGSVIYDTFAPTVAEIADVYIFLGYIYKQAFMDDADFENAVKHAKSQGVNVHKSTKAILKCAPTPSSIVIENGARFVVNGLFFTVIERLNDGYKLECETSGTKGNVSSGKLIPQQYIEGLEKIEIAQILEHAKDIESVEHLKERYYQKVNEPATSGNANHYKRWSLEVNGVGNSKVIEKWNGKGTVKVVITNSEMKAAPEELIQKTQSYIESVRPVGATITVASAKNKSITVNVKTKIAPGADINAIKFEIKSKIDKYFRSIAFASNYVSIAMIGNIILNTQNIIDYSELKLNSQSMNIEYGIEEVPILNNLVLEVDNG